MNERRSSLRHKSFLKGCVYYNNKLSSADCLVRDLSEGGARLKFFGRVTIPDVVELHLPHKDETFHAKVQWRVGDEIGVAFPLVEQAPPLAPASPVPELAERVTKLERQVAAQERKIQELQSALRQRQSAAI
jgi:PilZ domain-containing protein